MKKEIWYSKASYWLRDFINKYYFLKDKYAKENKEALKNVYKLFLNALYGSFCKRGQYESILYLPQDQKDNILEMVKNEPDIELFNDGKSGYKFYGDSFKEIKSLNLVAIRVIETKPKKKFPNILVGATITSYARVYLLESILKLGVDNFIYCDTDSIYFKTNMSEEELGKKLPLDKYELGKWGIDCKFKSGKILGAKRYVFFVDDKKIKFGFAGVNKNKINRDNIDEYLRADTELIDAVFKRHEDDYGIYFEWGNYITKLGTN